MLDAFQIAERYGFAIETHEVTTSDGYILQIWRLLSSDQNEQTSESRPIVYMIHGFASSGVGYMAHGTSSPAFYLYNQGYDIWLVNHRGNTYSRRHQTLDPDTDAEFWNFGIDEVGNDHIASIEYILQTTGRESLSTISMSIAGLTILGSESLNPDFYEQRVDVSLLLVPSVYFNDTLSPALRLGMSMPQAFDLLRMLNIHELAAYNPLMGDIAGFACTLLPAV